MAKIKIPIQLGDPAYFKDKSWTLSFNFNTKSWVSFHSYLPNFYIAENNFFYSGLNNCCGDFDFIASEIPSLIDCTIYGYCVAEGYELDCLIEGGCCCLPTTTTTSTTIISTTTTTTLSTACDLEGTIEEVCYVSTTTTTTECIRPNDLNTYSLITGFISEGIPFDSTVDKYVACDTMHWLEDNPSVTRTNIYAETTDIYIGAHLFLYNGTNDCECVPDGWYFTDESMFYGYVFHVEDCIITEVYTCEVTTTTTSTTVEPTTTTTTTTAYDCNLEGDVTEVCPTTSTTSTTVPPTTTTTTTCEPVEFEVIDIEWGTITTTTTTVCPIDAYLVDVVCEDVTTTTTTTVAPTTTTTTTVPPTTTTTTTYEPISTTTTTTTVLESCVEYGYLYNGYAATDAREISSSDDWVVPTIYQMQILADYLGADGNYTTNIVGNKLQESGSVYWDVIVDGTNEVGFNARGSSQRVLNGGFDGTLKFKFNMWSTTEAVAGANLRTGFIRESDQRFVCATNVSNAKYWGNSVRLIKTTTTLTHGQTGVYIGNDGKIYPTICIGTQEWVASNLAETLYRNGDPIPTVEDATTWAGLTTGAKCAYDNDYTNVGCDETGPTTTTTTTEEIFTACEDFAPYFETTTTTTTVS